MGYVAVAVLYLLLLVAIAVATESGHIPPRLARHPLTLALSLGVYASTWSYYGSVGFARSSGLSFLTIYLGPTLACALVPVIWAPLCRLAAEHQLGSLADLFAFRYRRLAAGALVTLFTLAGSIPYLAQQIHAVADSLRAVGVPGSPVFLGVAFTAGITVFGILFGARHVHPRERHDGLVVAIAFESLAKLVALLAVGAFAAFEILGAQGGIEAFLERTPEALAALARPAEEAPWLSLLVLSFGAAFLLPRQFHLAFTEGGGERALHTAAWAFPLYLLLLNLPILPILWAGSLLDPGGNADLYVLAVSDAAGPWLRVLAFVGGLSAASAMVIVTSLALGAMAANYLVLPIFQPGPRRDLYGFLLQVRRFLIAAILVVAYAFAYIPLPHGVRLVDFGLVSFVATAQLLPGLLALLFWQRATSRGFVWGLGAGMAIWVVALVMPLLARGGTLPPAFDIATAAGYAGDSIYTFATVLSLGVNTSLLGLLSLTGTADEAEIEAARACARDASLPAAAPAVARARDFEAELAPFLGKVAARKEVGNALRELGIDPDEQRPAELARLRHRIERNLSGLLGPLLARVVVDEGLRLAPEARLALADHFRLLEERLRNSRVRLDGLAAELDHSRRWLRGILEELPLGACVLGPDRAIALFNRALGRMVGLPAEEVVGRRVDDLPAPWNEALTTSEREISLGGRHLAIHRAALEGGEEIVLVEDRTAHRTLEAQLAHAERLASIGRFAAGVAHEIGNPLTGISLLAQNLHHEEERADLRERAGLILSESRRIEAIVRTLLAFSHGDTVQNARQVEEVDATALVEEAMRLARLHDRARKIELRAEVEEGLVLACDRQRMLQVLLNLLSNACDASPEGGLVRVVGRRARDGICLEVVDQGRGIAPGDLERIFEPFYTTKEPGRGTGLGLSVTYGIVREHGGEIEVESEPDRGTILRLLLPGRAHRGAA